MPVLAFYAIYVCSKGSRLIGASRTVFALGLGAGLASSYLLPFAAHRAYFDTANMTRVYGPNYAVLSQLFPMQRAYFRPTPEYGWHSMASRSC